MEIVRPVKPPQKALATPLKQDRPPEPMPEQQEQQPEQAPADSESTLPKTLPSAPAPQRMFTQQAQAETVAQQPQLPPQPFTQQAPAQQEFDDGIYMRDPNTGQLVKSELDQLPGQMEYIGGDPLRAVYQGLVWAAESLKRLAMTTPALAGLSPQAEAIIDQVATIGYQVTNAGAELTRGLWNWPFTRVIINQGLEQVLHPEEWGTFNRLYKEWYDDVVLPVESGQAKYDPNKVKSWVTAHEKEIADPSGFIRLCSQRYTMEKVAAKSAWTPTDVLSTSKPLGIRQSTTTGLESVFRRKPG